MCHPVQYHGDNCVSYHQFVQQTVTRVGRHPTYNLGVVLHDFLFDPPQPSGQCMYHWFSILFSVLSVPKTQPSYPCTVLTDLSAFSVRHRLTLYVNVDLLGHIVTVNIIVLVRGPSDLSVGNCIQDNALLDTLRALEKHCHTHAVGLWHMLAAA